MSVMFEVYYRSPPDVCKEEALSARVSSLGGRLTFREVPQEHEMGGVCLTYEFDAWEQAEVAAEALRQQGEHVEGPCDYGD
jgi:hypothetical protein